MPEEQLSKLDSNKRAIGKNVWVLGYSKYGTIVDVQNEDEFIVLINNQLKTIDIFDIRYVE